MNPKSVVWLADYSRRVTAEDVYAILGHLPTSHHDYERTRDELAKRDAQFVIRDRYQTSSSPAIERINLADIIEGES